MSKEPEFGQFERDNGVMKYIVTRHKSFGVVKLNHVSGGDGVFFGSAVQNSNYITLTVEMAEHLRDVQLHTEHIFGRNKLLIEIAMTNVQLAEMLFNANCGSGVPCTIKSCLDGNLQEIWRETRESPPQPTSSKKMYVDEFKTRMTQLSEELAEVKKMATKLVEAKTATKSDREKLSEKINSIEATIRNGLPWALEMFNEKVEEITMHAKAEVEAGFNSIIKKLGLQELKLAPEKLLGFEPNDEVVQ